ncbi:MAG TPA: hypothetical protein VFZ35_07705 [Sphingomicrobium sp.]
MTMIQILGAAAALGALVGPAVGQTTYPQSNQQTYPPGYGYPNPNYGTNVIQQIIDQLLGNRYNVTDRNAVSRCASAALAKAQRQYPYGAYGRSYRYDQRYNQSVAMRVAAITEVRRRSNGLRVRGLIDSGAYGYSYQYPYGNQPYADPRYAQTGDLTFRCDVDYRGRTSNVKISRNTAYRR